MLPRQVQQQVGSLAVVSVLAGLILTFTRGGFPTQATDIGPWLLVVAVWAVVLFVVSGIVPFVWFAATGFRARSARGGLMLWWLLLVVAAVAAHQAGIDLS